MKQKGKWEEAINHLMKYNHLSRKEAIKILRQYSITTMHK